MDKKKDWDVIVTVMGGNVTKEELLKAYHFKSEEIVTSGGYKSIQVVRTTKRPYLWNHRLNLVQNAMVKELLN